MINNKPASINVVGCGRAASSLLRLWQQQSLLSDLHIVNRSLASSRQAVKIIGAGTVVTATQNLPPAQMLLLGVPDSALADTALCAAGSSYELAFHLSGLVPATVLTPLSQAGAALASVHPVRSFTGPPPSQDDFHDTPCLGEGDQQALDKLQRWFESIGGRFIHCPDLQKSRYHSGLVIAGNYLCTLAWLADRTLHEAGLPADIAADLRRYLMQNVGWNLQHLSPAEALTGPIERGDGKALEQQLQAWESAPADLRRAFHALTAATLEMAQRESILSQADGDRLQRLLDRVRASAAAPVE